MLFHSCKGRKAIDCKRIINRAHRLNPAKFGGSTRVYYKLDEFEIKSTGTITIQMISFCIQIIGSLGFAPALMVLMWQALMMPAKLSTTIPGVWLMIPLFSATFVMSLVLGIALEGWRLLSAAITPRLTERERDRFRRPAWKLSLKQSSVIYIRCNIDSA